MEEKHRVRTSLFFPVIFLILIWMVKFFEIGMELDFHTAGVMPRRLSGLQGILFSPLIHGDWKHLFDNSIPVFLLTFALFYFYRGISFTIFLIIYVLGGIILWFIGRDAYHIGASGIIYGLAAFLFLSGIIRKVTHLMAISLLVVFLYGSLIWGLLPFDYEVSWEGHLSGAIVGVALSLLYRDRGPEPEKPSWELEEETDGEEAEMDGDEPGNIDSTGSGQSAGDPDSNDQAESTLRESRRQNSPDRINTRKDERKAGNVRDDAPGENPATNRSGRDEDFKWN
ncbi:MAG: rhomboid family intramembrane serine protease [Bacteroidales bacterium]|nr:rhomboid family intramembrane serine protease [Bacteroidales bacterium]MDT8432554.1 rhomboid family intramembrane serine protease [Bacteroidales bacterium]